MLFTKVLRVKITEVVVVSSDPGVLGPYRWVPLVLAQFVFDGYFVTMKFLIKRALLFLRHQNGLQVVQEPLTVGVAQQISNMRCTARVAVVGQVFPRSADTRGGQDDSRIAGQSRFANICLSQCLAENCDFVDVRIVDRDCAAKEEAF